MHKQSNSGSRRGLRWCRRAALVGLMVASLAAQGQPGAALPIPVGAAALPLSLILLLVVGGVSARHKASAADVEKLMKENNWVGAAIVATKQLELLYAPKDPAAAKDPQDQTEREATIRQWHLLRAYALQRTGRYAEALHDYQVATDAVEQPAASIQLNRGICLLVLGRWGEAEHLMLRIAASEPRLWEPHYNLGVIRSITGDKVGARLALERLRPLNAAMADSLDQHYIRGVLSAAEASRSAPDGTAQFDAAANAVRQTTLALPVVRGADLSSASAPGRLAEPALGIDGHVIALPPGEWILASLREFQIKGSPIATGSVDPEPPKPFPALAGSAIMLEGGALRAIVTFASNRPTRTFSVVMFEPQPCNGQDAIAAKRPGYEGYERPGTCVYARWLDTPGGSRSEDVRRAEAVARKLGARVPAGWYEFHYSVPSANFTQGRSPTFLGVHALWPASSLAGELVAIDWLTSLPVTADPATYPGHTTRPSIGWVGP